MWITFEARNMLQVLIVITLFMRVDALVTTEMPFCSGRSQIVPISSTNRLLLDGSTPALYSVNAIPTQPGTSCTCSVTPTADIRTLSVRLETSSIVTTCSTALRVALAPDYDYWAGECASQSYTLEGVGSRTVKATINFLGERADPAKGDSLFQVWLDMPENSISRNETWFRVSCLAPTNTSYSTTSSSSSSSPTTISSVDPNQTTNSGSTQIAGSSSGQSNTVVIVCVIIGVGLTLVFMTLCLLCYIARRIDRRSEKLERRTPRRIYRRICNTIRKLPDTLHIRRPLPPPPESVVDKTFKNRSKVFVTESGPYESIQSSMKQPIRMPTELGGNKNHSGDNDYGYLYPISHNVAKPKNEAIRTLSADIDYITPIRGTQRENIAQFCDSIAEDRTYINTQQSVAITDSTNDTMAEERATESDNADRASSGYMAMGSRPEHGHNSGIHSRASRALCPNSDCIVDDPTRGTENNAFDNELDKQSAHDTYINLNADSVNTCASQMTPRVTDINSNNVHEGYSTAIYIDMHGGNIETTTDVIKTHTNGNSVSLNPSTVDTHATRDTTESDGASASRDSNYMSMDGAPVINPTPHLQASTKDKTFPNLMKLNMASIKTMGTPGTAKKRGPEVKPKPKRFVRNMADDS